MKISRFGDLNDPFELLAAQLSDKDYRRAMNSWKTDFHTTKGLLCFSRSWHSPVLWSHYGDKHYGICLGFDIPDRYACTVCYARERLPVRFKDNNADLGLDEKFVNELLLTKYSHWEYEDEIRMFVGLDEGTREAGLFFYPFDRNLILREVILGPRCEIPLEGIRALVERTNGPTAVIKARLAFNSFSVVEDQRFHSDSEDRAVKGSD